MQVTDDSGRLEVAAVILAAGRSSRMAAGNKLLLPVRGLPMVRHAALAALASKAAEVVAGTGHQATEVAEALSGLDLRRVHNPDFARGMATSLQVGIGALDAKIAGAVVLLGDMPDVPAAVIDALIDAFRRAEGSRICQPRYRGRPGNPVLLPRRLFADVRHLSGDMGARTLLEAESARILGVDVDSPAIHMDIDTAEDLPPGPAPEETKKHRETKKKGAF